MGAVELVRILHGTLNVESKVDEGSIFRQVLRRSRTGRDSRWLLSVELPMGKDHIPPDRLTLADT